LPQHTITNHKQPSNGVLTPNEVMTELKIGRKLCYKLLKEGKIPSTRVGHLYRIPRQSLEQLLMKEAEQDQ
jgi:excisionase family DNA binding protein